GGHRASFLNNIIYNSADNPPAVCLLAGTALHWNQWQEMGMEQGSILADPQFVDEAGGDFRLKDTSPAWALGFKRIPVEKIGCYEDEHRVSWPITPNHDRFREKPVLHKSPDYKPKKSKAPAGLKFIDISKIGEIGW
ncbi:MAG: hypothetical protein ACYST9_01700, partial [Planctomycetota bacterium]